MKHLSVSSTLGSGLLASSTANTDTVDHVTLLGLVPKTTSFVGARRARSTVNDIERTEFPAADTEKEAENVALLLLLDFFDVLKSSHFCCCCRRVVGGVFEVVVIGDAGGNWGLIISRKDAGLCVWGFFEQSHAKPQ